MSRPANPDWPHVFEPGADERCQYSMVYGHRCLEAGQHAIHRNEGPPDCAAGRQLKDETLPGLDRPCIKAGTERFLLPGGQDVLLCPEHHEQMERLLDQIEPSQPVLPRINTLPLLFVTALIDQRPGDLEELRGAISHLSPQQLMDVQDRLVTIVGYVHEAIKEKSVGSPFSFQRSAEQTDTNHEYVSGLSARCYFRMSDGPVCGGAETAYVHTGGVLQ